MTNPAKQLSDSHDVSAKVAQTAADAHEGWRSSATTGA